MTMKRFFRRPVPHQSSWCYDGEAEAQYILATRYLTGNGVPEDVAEARRWRQSASCSRYGEDGALEQGYPRDVAWTAFGKTRAENLKTLLLLLGLPLFFAVLSLSDRSRSLDTDRTPKGRVDNTEPWHDKLLRISEGLHAAAIWGIILIGCLIFGLLISATFQLGLWALQLLLDLRVSTSSWRLVDPLWQSIFGS